MDVYECVHSTSPCGHALCTIMYDKQATSPADLPARDTSDKQQPIWQQHGSCRQPAAGQQRHCRNKLTQQQQQGKMRSSRNSTTAGTCGLAPSACMHTAAPSRRNCCCKGAEGGRQLGRLVVAVVVAGVAAAVAAVVAAMTKPLVWTPLSLLCH